MKLLAAGEHCDEENEEGTGKIFTDYNIMPIFSEYNMTHETRIYRPYWKITELVLYHISNQTQLCSSISKDL